MDKTKERGTVKVVNGRYKPSGQFHFINANQPIYNEKNELVGVTNPRDLIHIHTYGGEAIFFESLSKGKLLATQCNNTECEEKGTVYIPFRIHCPNCFGKNTIKDITGIAKKTSTVHTFMITERTGAFNTLPKPIKFVNVEFEGVDTILMGYFSVGEPEIGMKVLPIFKTKDPSYTILDLAWVPVGTDESELPEGFRF